MSPSLSHASVPEHQLAVAILAHAVRGDNFAIAASLSLLSDSPAELRPIGVIAALIAEFQRGIDGNRHQLAGFFSSRALSFAADDAAHQQETRRPHEG